MLAFLQQVNLKRAYTLLVVLVLGLGVAVRTAHFPNIPPGLNQDEAASAYEAYALAETGHDKWGNHLPVYLPGWGSGQNALQSYLMVPVVKAFGLSIASARLVPLLLGLLTLPLFFYCLRPLGRYPALLGLALLALAPWHFMLSRWALESNLVVFWMLLGCTTLSRAISTQRRRWIIPALLPFGVALYAYGTTAIILPLLLAVGVGFGWDRIRARPGAWLLAVGLFGLVAAPFGLFFIENYVLGHNLAWTDKLFFSTPMLPATRLSQVGQSSLRDIYEFNVKIVRSGFDDRQVFNQLADYPLLLDFTWTLAAVGFGVMLYRLGRWRRRLAERPADVVATVFLAWGLACLPLLFLFSLNVNRANHFFLPCLALAAWVTALLIENLRADVPRQLIRGAVLGFFLVEGSLAARFYHLYYPHGPIREEFVAGLPEAFAAVDQLWGIDQVRITNQMYLPYVYTLFYLRYPPEQFRREVQVEVVDGAYKVHKFGRYVFEDQYLVPGRPYAYLARKDEVKEDAQHHKQVLFSNEGWEVGTVQPLAPPPAGH
ncbi:MAG: glycosyltransferase family 39 protein [Janthinobacterium lividum]